MDVIASVTAKYTIDPQRIFVAGQDAGCALASQPS